MFIRRDYYYLEKNEGRQQITGMKTDGSETAERLGRQSSLRGKIKLGKRDLKYKSIIAYY